MTESFKVITVLINDDVYSVSILEGDCLEVEIYNQLGFDCDKVGYYIIEEPDYNKAFNAAEYITDSPINEAIQKLKDIYGAYPDKYGVISTIIHGFDVVFFQAYEDSKHLTFEI